MTKKREPDQRTRTARRKAWFNIHQSQTHKPIDGLTRQQRIEHATAQSKERKFFAHRAKEMMQAINFAVVLEQKYTRHNTPGLATHTAAPAPRPMKKPQPSPSKNKPHPHPKKNRTRPKKTPSKRKGKASAQRRRIQRQFTHNGITHFFQTTTITRKNTASLISAYNTNRCKTCRKRRDHPCHGTKKKTRTTFLEDQEKRRKEEERAAEQAKKDAAVRLEEQKKLAERVAQEAREEVKREKELRKKPKKEETYLSQFEDRERARAEERRREALKEEKRKGKGKDSNAGSSTQPCKRCRGKGCKVCQ